MNLPPRAPLRIGLTGGIGSGKSTACARWVALGADLVDTDAIARSLTAPGGEAVDALRTTFGAASIGPDGALDRDWMRARAFGDDAARRQLEAILHPLIAREARARAGAATGPVVVFDVPLLVESGTWRARVDRVLVIDCAEERQIARVLRRPGWTGDAARSVIDRQAARGRRLAAADAVIANDHDDLAALHAEVDALWRLWVGPIRP